jgi:hypothetical protein
MGLTCGCRRVRWLQGRQPPVRQVAERIARQLGLRDKPLDPNGNGWWIWALVRWAEERDPESGHTAFVLRRPVVEALQRLHIVRV